jgi:hypothetical protein
MTLSIIEILKESPLMWSSRPNRLEGELLFTFCHFDTTILYTLLIKTLLIKTLLIKTLLIKTLLTTLINATLLLTEFTYN